jgi:hypothetical protein
MMRRNWLLCIGVLVVGTLAWAAGPMPDTFFVHFNDPVIVSNQLTLSPGNYKFQRITHPTDPAVFTIINGDNGKVLGTTPPATLAQNGENGNIDVKINEKGTVILDQVDGKDYLDTAYLQGMGHGFMFQQPSSIRDKVKDGGRKIQIDAHTGGSE